MMTLRQYKKLQIKIINQAKDGDLLVVRFDMDKIKPELMGKFMKMVRDKAHNCIAIPIDMNIDRLDTKNLELIRDRINREIESR